VTFRYKKAYANGDRSIQYGLIAEDVAEVLPDLAVYNRKGKPETVKYHLLPTFLLAAYQQDHKAHREQTEEIDRLRKTIRAEADEIARERKINRSQAKAIAALERRLSMLETQYSASRTHAPSKRNHKSVAHVATVRMSSH
jgi:septal ring factor EnvC (AmiA/AmiB activator)